MPVVSFFKAGKSLTIKEIEALSDAVFDGTDIHRSFSSVSAIGSAKAGDITFASGPKQRDIVAQLEGAVIFCNAAFAGFVPDSCLALVCENPAAAFNRIARALYPDAIRSPLFEGCQPTPEGALVHPSAKLEAGVLLSPGSSIGEGVEIGSGSRIGPGVSIAAHSAIGRNCDIGANVTIQCAFIG
ncbi:MAG: LpxD N-terminal domain-containing protein, partial [Notoacmeibacter sp.]